MKQVILVILTFVSISVYAQCTIGSRDFEVCDGSCVKSSTAGILGQAFTACADGVLNSISVASMEEVTSADGVNLEIYKGDLNSGTLVGTLENVALTVITSTEFPFNGTDYTTIDVSALEIPVASGELYTFQFSKELTLMIEESTLDTYTGGYLYYDGNEQAEYDLFFGVSIEAATANALPTIAGLDGDSFTYYEGSGESLLDQGTVLSLTHEDNPSDWNGGVLTVSIVVGEDAAEDLLSVNTAIVSLGGTTAASSVSVSSTVIGTLNNDIAVGNDLTITLNANATLARVETLIQNITYANTDMTTPTSGARIIRVIVSDGDGGTSANNDVTVTVEDLPDVAINEIVTDPQTDWSTDDFDGTDGTGDITSQDQYIELYVATAGIDFESGTGWQIEIFEEDGVTLRFSGDLTSAGAFQTVRYIGFGNINASQVGDYIVLGNPRVSSLTGDGDLVLLDENGHIIDRVDLGGGSDQAPAGSAADVAHEAVSRIPNAVDTDDDAADFTQQYATPGKHNEVPTGYTVAIDQTVYNLSNYTAASFTITGGLDGESYYYTFDSDGGGTPVTGSGTLSGAGPYGISGIDLSGLDDGQVTLTVYLSTAVGDGFSVTDAVLYDSFAPTASTFSPVDEATDVSLSASLKITFSEDIAIGTGNLLIQKVSDNSIVQTIAVTDQTQVSMSGAVLTITPSSQLPENESLYVTMSSGAITDEAGNPYAGISAATTWNFTTINQIGFSANGISVNEGNTGNATLIFTISLSQAAPAGGASVDYVTSDGTATAGSDYIADSGTLNFAAGENSKQLEISVYGDYYIEDDETVILTLSNPTGTNVAITDPTSTGTISNDDVAGFTVVISDGTTSTSEAKSTDGFTVVLEAAPVSDVVILVSSGDTDEGTVDAPSLTFTPSNWNTAQTVTVTGVDDNMVDGTKSYDITLAVDDANSDDDFDEVDNQTVAVTNLDNDQATVTIADVSGGEEDGTITVKATLDVAVEGGFSVDVSTADGTATTAGNDYTAVSGQTLTFAGTTGEQQTFTITIIDDSDPEGNETMAVSMSNLSTNLAVDIDDVAIVTIVDDDLSQLSVEDASVLEGASGTTTLTFTVSLDKASTATTTVDYATTDNTSGDTADAGTDYTNTSGTLTFSAGETSKTIAVSITGDEILEADETFTLTLSNLNGTAVAFYNTTATGTITNDDNATVSLADVSGAEDAGVITITATLDHGVQGGFTVDVLTADGTATVADNDYTAVSSHTLTFAGTAGEEQTFTMLPTADTKLEADETVTVSMSNLSTALDVTLSANATVTLTNDDTATVTIADVSGEEEGGTITLTATLDHAVQGGFTVDVSTADGTATVADNDYTAVSSRTLTFAGTAGEEQTFTVTPIADDKEEAEETIVISMSNLLGTSFSVNIADQATITLLNNDHAPVIAAGQTFDAVVAVETGTVLGTISATDADDGTTLQAWTITSGNTDIDSDGNAPFVIQNGELVVNDADDLDVAQVTSFTLTVTVSDGTNTSAAAAIAIQVSKLPQTITFAAIEDQKVGQDPVVLTATGGGSGNPVTFTMETVPVSGVALLTDNVITLVGAGTVTVTAQQAGNDAYAAATPVSQTFTIDANTLFLPTLFTPNGDLTNDRFLINGGGNVAKVQFAVYDREGTEVFRSSSWSQLSQTGWDGTTHGTAQPQGAYVWVIRGTFTDGSSLTVDGKTTGVIRLAR